MIMPRLRLSPRSFLIALLAVAVSAAFSLSAGRPVATHAASGSNVSGFAWSETVGWLSFNNSSDGSVQPYGVSVDTSAIASGGTGAFSGQAWSENLGWISFDRAMTGNPPSNDPGNGSGPIAAVDWSTGKVGGWARVISGCQAMTGVPAAFCTGASAGAMAGGWDGWISLSGSNYGVTIDKTTGKFGGYAWGSDVVGWLDVAPVGAGVTLSLPSAPSCTASWNPSSITAGGVATLYWTVTPQATIQSSYSCTGISAETGNVGMLRSHAFRFSAGGTETCTVSTVRTSDGATASCQTLVPLTVNQVCLSGAQDNNCYIPSGVHVVSSSPVTGTCIRGTAKTLGTHSCAYVCTADPNSTNGKWVLSSNACMGSAPSNPTAYITASPTRVQNGNSTTLSWSASGVTSCSVTGPGGTTISNTFSNTATTTQSVTVTGQSKYTLSCDGGAASSSVIVNVVPKYNEF